LFDYFCLNFIQKYTHALIMAEQELNITLDQNKCRIQAL